MSFLSGLKKVVGWASGGSNLANLTKTALLAYSMYKLNKSLNKDNEPTSETDPGVRLQISPNTNTKIPVVYGSAFLGGMITDAEMSNDNKTMFYCLTISEYTGDLYSTGGASQFTFREIFWNDQKLVFKSDGKTVDYAQDRNGTIDRSLSGLVQVFCYGSSSTNSLNISGYSNPGLTPAYNIMPGWTTSHTMSNLVFAIIRVDYNQDKGVTGLGDVKFHLQNSMTKPADAIYDYMRNSLYGIGIPAADIDTASLTRLNTYSDLSVIYEDQLLGPDQALAARYRINGIVDTGRTVLSNLEALASSTASWVSFDVHAGKWSLVINKSESAIAAFDDSNVIGSISITASGIDALYNRVKAEFPNRDIRDIEDFITIALPSQDINPFEYENTLNIVYDLINEPVQAEVLAFIELKQSRIDLVVRFTTDYSYINLTAGDVISLTNARVDWDEKKFRIINITENQDESGALFIDIIALEYDENVYSTADLFRYSRTDQNGIIGIGSIGTPTIPTVTKFESDSRPRIVVTTTAPTGIVERMEFWRTTDVTAAESDRSYALIGSTSPIGGGTYDVAQEVVFEYDSQGEGNFLIKCRGLNSAVTGPYSEPSGIVFFAPKQIPDEIGDDTKLAGIVGALGVLQLLSLINDLMGGDLTKGLFDKIFETFEEVTGIDLLGDASEGELVVASDIKIKKDTVDISDKVSSLDFTGPIVPSVVSGKDINIKLIDGAANKDILAWNAASSKWELISGCISCDFPEPPPPEPGEPGGPALPTECKLIITSSLPPIIDTWDPSEPQVELARTHGSFYASFSVDPGTEVGGVPLPPKPLYAPLQAGVGNVYLYGTDGTLEQTLTESQLIINNDIVEFPFAPRVPGKDYYILIEEGVLIGCDCENVEFDTPKIWTFTTTQVASDPYPYPTAATLPPLIPANAPVYQEPLRLIRRDPNFAEVICHTAAELALTFSEPVAPVNGIITVKKLATDETVGTYVVSSGIFSGAEVTWGFMTDIEPGEGYSVTVPAGIITTDREDYTETNCGASQTISYSQTVNDLITFNFYTSPELIIETYRLYSLPYVRDADLNNVNIRSTLEIQFNKEIKVKPSRPAYISVFEQNTGALHQRIDLTATFESDKYGDIYRFEDNLLKINVTNIMKPGLNYYVIIDEDAIYDAACDLPFEGVGDTTTITWQCDGIILTPAPGYVPGNPPETIEAEFDRPVTPGEGKINITDSQGNLIGQLDSNDPAIAYS